MAVANGKNRGLKLKKKKKRCDVLQEESEAEFKRTVSFRTLGNVGKYDALRTCDRTDSHDFLTLVAMQWI